LLAAVGRVCHDLAQEEDRVLDRRNTLGCEQSWVEAWAEVEHASLRVSSLSLSRSPSMSLSLGAVSSWDALPG